MHIYVLSFLAFYQRTRDMSDIISPIIYRGRQDFQLSSSLLGLSLFVILLLGRVIVEIGKYNHPHYRNHRSIVWRRYQNVIEIVLEGGRWTEAPRSVIIKGYLLWRIYSVKVRVIIPIEY